MVLSLIFAKGCRPTANDIVKLSQENLAAKDPGIQPFGVSHIAPVEQGWVELLAMGLTFDCRGLSQAQEAARPASGDRLSLATEPDGETVELLPGPHLADGGALMPVVRTLASLGAALSQLPGAEAVVWNSARCWMEPGYFRKVVSGWLNGGAFPALGLTMLRPTANGGLVSVGLSLFTGQELHFEPARGQTAAGLARIATRLIHELVLLDPIGQPQECTGPNGEELLVVPARDGQQLRVMIRE